MEPFIYNGLPSRVIFGAGSLDELDREIGLLGATRAIVLSTPQQRGQAEALAAGLGSRAAGVYAEAVMHVPVETARAARSEEHTSELQSPDHLVCRLLLEKKKQTT